MSDPRSAAADAGVRIVLRPMASTVPVGFVAFAVGSVLLTGIELHWVPLAQASQVTLIELAFVAPLELLAGALAIAARDVGAATALLVFGAAWAAIALVLRDLPPAGTSDALGLFLCTLAVVLAGLAGGAAAGKPLLAAVLVLGAVRFAFTAVYELSGGSWAETVSGWLGLPLAAVAAYFALALLIEDARGRTVLPIVRRGSARDALEEPFEAQIRHLHHEAGVRDQL